MEYKTKIKMTNADAQALFSELEATIDVTVTDSEEFAKRTNGKIYIVSYGDALSYDENLTVSIEEKIKSLALQKAKKEKSKSVTFSATEIFDRKINDLIARTGKMTEIRRILQEKGYEYSSYNEDGIKVRFKDVYSDYISTLEAAIALDLVPNQKLVEAQSARRKEEEAAQKKKEEEAEAAFQAEKKKWVEEFGSERLKKAIALGYDATKTYIAERGKATLGDDYVLDYAKDVTVKSRSNPSLEALNEEERITNLKNKLVESVTAIWLPRGLSEITENEDDSQATEAVEVEFLKNFFYKIM